MMLRIKNVTERDVERLNKLFPAGREVTVDLDPTEREFMQVKACRALRILPDTALKVTPESAAVAPVVVTKQTEPTAVAAIAVAKGEGSVEFSCPYCAATSAAKVGILSHVRTKHPEQYAEFKAGV